MEKLIPPSVAKSGTKLFIYFLFQHRLKILGIFFLNVMMGTIPSVDGILLQKLISFIEETNHITSSSMPMDAVKLLIFYALWWESINIVGRLYDYLYMKTLPQIKLEIVNKCYCILQSYDNDFFQNNLVGEIANRITDAAKSAELIYAVIFEKIIKKLFVIIFGVITIYVVSPKISYIFLLWTLIYLIIVASVHKYIKKYSVNYGAEKSNLAGSLVDSISNISSIRFFSAWRAERAHINKNIEKTFTANMSLEWFMFKLRYLLGLLCSLAILTIVYFIFKFRFLSELSIGESVLIISICVASADQLSDLMQEIGDLFEDIGFFVQILPLINYNTREDAPFAKDLKIVEPKIEFKDVTFYYRRNNNIFKDQNIVINPRERVGVAGFSGSGKTTFVNLILRLYDIDSGQINIDGQNIKDVTSESLYKNISVIPQEPLLFHRSILDNIRYARPDATYEDVRGAASLACIDDEIMSMKNGYNTDCGEGGGKLSCGQRQRVIIARAFLKQAPILIMDEVSSSLDISTEHLIQKSLKKLMENKTVIVIAHRMHTLLGMDRIILFNQGQIDAIGTHQQLIDTNQIYKKLWKIETY